MSNLKSSNNQTPNKKLKNLWSEFLEDIQNNEDSDDYPQNSQKKTNTRNMNDHSPNKHENTLK